METMPGQAFRVNYLLESKAVIEPLRRLFVWTVAYLLRKDEKVQEGDATMPRMVQMHGQTIVFISMKLKQEKRTSLPCNKSFFVFFR